jgi:hypothetical protein
MAKVRIWTARLHDRDAMFELQSQVETELSNYPRATVEAKWLVASAGGDNTSEFNLIAIVEVR